MDKVMKAVIALGGDLRNTRGHYQKDKFLSFEDEEYLTFNFEDSCDNYICTVDEFNAAADQWRKEAYMHNAALDLDWDLGNCENGFGRNLIMFHKEYGYNTTLSDFLGDAALNRGWVEICTEQEFIDHCEANKPKKPSERMKKALDEAKEIETRFTNLNCRSKTSELTTIYTIDKPLKDLPDELAAELFNHWRNGGEIELYCGGHWSACSTLVNNWQTYRAVRPKSERELFVERCDNSCVIHSNRESMMITFGELFDAGCRFTEQSK